MENIKYQPMKAGTTKERKTRARRQNNNNKIN